MAEHVNTQGYHQICFCLKITFCNQLQFHLSLQLNADKNYEYILKNIQGLALPTLYLFSTTLSNIHM
jgi:hypothetical protein